MSVASSLANLETRRDAISAELAAITSSSAAGPDFSLDGVSVNWDAHKAALLKEFAEITALIERLSGPCIIYTQGR